MKYQDELSFAKSLAYKAGDIMRRYFQAEDIDTRLKEDKTPITIADETINQLVIDSVKEAFPQCGVIGEEGSYETERNELWVVDPIDGTKPYSIGIPVATFCLAYIVNGEVKVAVVYDPYQDRLYHAVIGGGAFVNDKPIKVSSESEIQGHNMAMGGKKRLADLGTHIRHGGVNRYELYSYSYAAAQVASGGFIAAGMEYGSPWDAAAASLLVEEAGGVATDLLGNKRNYNEWGEGIMLTNGLVHNELIKTLDYENFRD